VPGIQFHTSRDGRLGAKRVALAIELKVARQPMESHSKIVRDRRIDITQEIDNILLIKRGGVDVDLGKAELACKFILARGRVRLRRKPDIITTSVILPAS
jgi:hypothetical protein